MDSAQLTSPASALRTSSHPMESTASAVELAATSALTPLPAAHVAMVTFSREDYAYLTAPSEPITEVTNAILAQMDAEAATVTLTADHATLVSTCILDLAGQAALLEPSPSRIACVWPAASPVRPALGPPPTA